MAKIEQVLKSEIIRLAKKQIRDVCVPLARDVRGLKRRVSQLHKTVTALDKLRSELEAKKAAEGTKLQAPAEQVKAARLSPLLIKKLRARLGISQGQLACLVGVSGPAVAFWEQGRSRPQGPNRAALVALRGVGRRQVKRMLAEKVGQGPQKAEQRKRARPRAGRQGGEGRRRLRP
jgi:DNA-binding transcriptional regulator YiaG